MNYRHEDFQFSRERLKELREDLKGCNPGEEETIKELIRLEEENFEEMLRRSN